jgi:tetratricopeptide (TPR) repeat protein
MAVAVNVQAVQHRLARHYLDKLHNLQKIYERGGDSVYTALIQFEQEWSQIQQWQGWAVKHAQDDADAAVLCYEFPEAAFDLLNLRQLLPERIQWLESGLTAARQRGSLEGEIDILLTLVSRYDSRGETSLVEEYAQRALTLAYQLQNQQRLGLAFLRMGDVWFTKGNFASAQEYQEQALPIFQKLGDRRNAANVLQRLANIQVNSNQFEAVSSYLEEAVVIWQRLGAMNGLAKTLATLGQNSQHQGEYAAASDYYERSLALARAIGNQTLIATIQTNSGIIADIQGDLVKALECYEEARGIFEKVGSRLGIAAVSANMAVIAVNQGDHLAARRYQESALEGYRSTGYMGYIILALANLSPILIHLGETQQAIHTLREAVTLVNQHPGLRQVTTLLSVVELFITLDRPDEAALLAGLALHHPTAEQENREGVAKLRPQLDAVLGADAVDAAFEQGKTLDLEATLADLLPKLEALDPQYIEN